MIVLSCQSLSGFFQYFFVFWFTVFGLSFFGLLLSSEILSPSAFPLPACFGIFRAALLFICQGSALAFRLLLSSATTLIEYHIFAALSTTFFKFFHFFKENIFTLKRLLTLLAELYNSFFESLFSVIEFYQNVNT